MGLRSWKATPFSQMARKELQARASSTAEGENTYFFDGAPLMRGPTLTAATCPIQK